MHSRLFENQKALDPADLSKYAGDIKADIPKFEQCLNSQKSMDDVNKEIAKGQDAGINGVPIMFIGYTESDKPDTIKIIKTIKGAQPYSVYKETFDNLLSTIPPSTYRETKVTPTPQSDLLALKEGAGGFRGLKWGTEFSTVKDSMIYLKTDPSHGGIKKYSKKDDDLKIAGATLESIEYGFWQDKLCSVDIKFKGYVNFTSLKDATFEKFGAGQKPNRFMEQYIWTGEITGMILEYKEILNKGYLLMFSNEINEQQKRADAEKAKKGANTGF
jgi:hypothetical protein